VVALLASHNRCAKTVACLRSYFGQACGAPVERAAVLVDDGSVDETVASVATEFPAARIVEGTGELYWAAAMALAERTAMADPPDFLLWLNDDVELGPGALETLMRTAGPGRDRIVVGAVCDPVDGALSYSGVRRLGRRARLRGLRLRDARDEAWDRERRRPRDGWNVPSKLLQAVEGAEPDLGRAPRARPWAEGPSSAQPRALSEAPRQRRLAHLLGDPVCAVLPGVSAKWKSSCRRVSPERGRGSTSPRTTCRRSTPAWPGGLR
jgi:hypothetical protein